MIKTLSDVDLKGKTVLIRADLNVPIDQGKITSDIRIQAVLPTIEFILNQGAKVLLMSHLGRPNEGEFKPMYSLKPVADYLSKWSLSQRSDEFHYSVDFISDYLTKPINSDANIAVLENVRFNHGEKANDKAVGEQYANLCDVFVMDAFGTAHRAQASTEAVIYAIKNQGKTACMGLLLEQELQTLNTALHKPKSPVVAIVGGSKVSSKLEVLHSLSGICDSIIVGGGIANTFLVAKGVNVGSSLYEPDLVASAKAIMQKVQILLPTDVVVTQKSAIDFDRFNESLLTCKPTTKSVNAIDEGEMILDIAKTSVDAFAQTLMNAKTILWNGPLGVFEVDQFAIGTKTLAQAVANSNAFSIAGGGDTLAAIDQFGVQERIDYLSTGGGAFLEFLEGKDLPAIEALKA